MLKAISGWGGIGWESLNAPILRPTVLIKNCDALPLKEGLSVKRYKKGREALLVAKTPV